MSNPYVIKTVKCAQCGKAGQETNHWFVLAVEGGKFRCRLLASVASAPEAHSSSHDATGLKLTKFEEPACGQQCAQKLFERYLAGELTRRSARQL